MEVHDGIGGRWKFMTALADAVMLVEADVFLRHAVFEESRHVGFPRVERTPAVAQQPPYR